MNHEMVDTGETFTIFQSWRNLINSTDKKLGLDLNNTESEHPPIGNALDSVTRSIRLSGHTATFHQQPSI